MTAHTAEIPEPIQISQITKIEGNAGATLELLMGIRVSRHSHTTGEYRLWGSGQVEVFATALGVAVEFTRRVGRGSTTFQIEFDDDGCHELVSAMRARRKPTQLHQSRQTIADRGQSLERR